MLTNAYIDNLQLHGGDVYGIREFNIGSPAPRAVAYERPSDHGATDATRFYGPRVFEVTGRVLASSPAALWEAVDALKASLVLGSYHTLRFRREGLSYDERATVRVDSPVDMPLVMGSNHMVQFGVSLFAADPRIYADTVNEASYDPTAAGRGGLWFPLVFPLDFSVAGGGSQMTVLNEGTIATPATFVVTGPVINPIIDNGTTGVSIYTQDTELTASDYIVVDTGARTLLLGGVTARPDLVDASRTNWFYLEPGTNALRLRGSGMSAGSTRLSVTFRSARI